MRTFIQYVGPADVRELSAADFKKAGVEGRKATYQRGVQFEVEDQATADALLTDPLFAGEFVEVIPAEDEADKPAMTEKNLVGDKATSGSNRDVASK